MKTAFRIIYYVCLGFLGVVVLLLIVSVLPVMGNYKIKIVLSGSMEPEINKGGIVAVKPDQDYKIGDVINFQDGSESVTHRINDMRIVGGEAKYITKGDANNAPDRREISKKEVLGKVIFDVPYLGYLVSFVQKPVGFILLLVVPAAVIIGDEARKIYVEIKKKRT